MNTILLATMTVEVKPIEGKKVVNKVCEGCARCNVHGICEKMNRQTFPKISPPCLTKYYEKAAVNI